MIKKCIGIISYLPDNEEIRTYRKNKLDKLLAKCKELFNLPVILIAQNYLEKDIWYFKNKYDNIEIKDHLSKLGITGARKELRAEFLNSYYDYLIMLDDDVELYGESGEEYLKQIDDNPNCFIENNKSRLQLFAISKEIFNKQDFNDIDPEKGEAFEDRIFFYTLCKKFPEAHKKFIDIGVREHAIATGDKYSTWYHDQDLISMLNRTQELINKN